MLWLTTLYQLLQFHRRSAWTAALRRGGSQRVATVSKWQAQLLQALKTGDHLIDLPPAQRQQYVSQGYFTCLREVVGIDDEDVLHIARHSVSDWSNAAAELLTVEEARWGPRFKRSLYDPENPTSILSRW